MKEGHVFFVGSITPPPSNISVKVAQVSIVLLSAFYVANLLQGKESMCKVRAMNNLSLQYVNDGLK